MARTILASGADISLFHVAARELGNPMQAWQIASLSGLTDPMLSGVVTLTLPAPDASQTTGLPTQ